MVTIQTITIEPPPLHPSQKLIWETRPRFTVLACGRRWGKTRLGVLLCIFVAICGGRAWWVAPSYPVATVGWRLLRKLAMQIPGVQVNLSDKLISFPGGGEVQVRSADNPDSLRGDGLDLVVLDECAFTREEAWAESLRPALADRLGSAVFISTPKGRNWFWRLWLRCQDPAYPDWQGWQLPTSDNPHIDAGEIEEARKSLPEKVFDQEFSAMFVSDAGGVFRRVMDAATAMPEFEPTTGGQYIIGVDWGKYNDFTVLTVINVITGSIVYIDRFNQIDYTVQLNRLKALNDLFKPVAIIAERNSMGDPLIETLQRMGMPVFPFLTTNATKARAMDELALAFEQSTIKIISDPTLVGELQAYEMERLPSGLLRYNAPAGMHDDCVVSAAIGWQGALEWAEPEQESIIVDGHKVVISVY